ncbi:hypothetical protein KSP39_PZI018530 [Platanthera zijinensis]|uniref:Uncharacterized protein n=1 Tax=Platanthera zijinensis TaxID=2320716 RepID=A0AAP0B3K4_9ASPA
MRDQSLPLRPLRFCTSRSATGSPDLRREVEQEKNQCAAQIQQEQELWKREPMSFSDPERWRREQILRSSDEQEQTELQISLFQISLFKRPTGALKQVLDLR